MSIQVWKINVVIYHPFMKDVLYIVRIKKGGRTGLDFVLFEFDKI